MSKLYNRYIELKKKDNNKYYLFNSGLFYIFIDDDAIKISNITRLKLTKLNDNICKCGFPKNCLNKYLNIFKRLNLNIEVVDIELLIDKIKNTKLDRITPIEAYSLLREIEDYYE